MVGKGAGVYCRHLEPPFQRRVAVTAHPGLSFTPSLNIRRALRTVGAEPARRGGT